MTGFSSVRLHSGSGALRRLPGLFGLLVLLLPFWVAAAPVTSKDYTLEPGDVVSVKVFQEPDLDRELRVSQEGDLYLPLIGRVEARGRSVAEVERVVREAYDRDYLVNPQINILVVKYQVSTVNVLGAVNSPQAVEYPPEQQLTLIDAVSRAGGFACRAPCPMGGWRILSSTPMNSCPEPPRTRWCCVGTMSSMFRSACYDQR